MKRNIAGLTAYVLILMCIARVNAQANDSSPTTKNEIGLVIGATEVPSIGLADGGTIHLNSSLVFGADYDRQVLGRRTTLNVGIDFVASPFDVKASFPAPNASPEYAYLLVAPHSMGQRLSWLQEQLLQMDDKRQQLPANHVSTDATSRWAKSQSEALEIV